MRELKRQIGSLYFERSGLSHNKERLSEIANAVATKSEPKDVIRDPYVFEFLGLRPQEVLSESDLESALIEKEIRLAEQEIADIRERYDVFSKEDLVAGIEQGEIAGHPAWEDYIVWKNKEAHIARLRQAADKG